MLTISVCIPGTRPDRLGRCLKTLKDQQPSGTRVEVLVCAQANGVAEETLAHIPDAVVLTLRRPNPRVARNLLLERARGDLLLFLDDDVVAPPGLLANLVRLAHRYPDVDVFGGPNLTPPGSPRFETIEGAVLGSPFASGPVYRRYRRSRGRLADDRSFTLCNLAVRREAMLPFVTEIGGGEENALLMELERRGSKMRYESDLLVYHGRRPTLRTFASQMVKYGLGRGHVVRRSPRTLRPAYFVPTALLAYLIVVPALVTLTPWLLIPLMLYALALTIGALVVATGLRDLTAAPLAAVLITTTHLCYAAGTVLAFVRPMKHLSHLPDLRHTLFPDPDSVD